MWQKGCRNKWENLEKVEKWGKSLFCYVYIPHWDYTRQSVHHIIFCMGIPFFIFPQKMRWFGNFFPLSAIQETILHSLLKLDITTFCPNLMRKKQTISSKMQSRAVFECLRKIWYSEYKMMTFWYLNIPISQTEKKINFQELDFSSNRRFA